MKNTIKPITIISTLTAILLVVGCFRLPIGYYTFLRIVVFVSSVIWTVSHIEKGLSFDMIVTALLCILFNPILPIYLHSKLAWVIIDALAAGWFGYLLAVSLKRE